MTYNPGGFEPRSEPMGSPAYVPPVQPAYQQYVPTPPPAPPKKRRTGLLIAAGVVMAVIVSATIVFTYLTVTGAAPWTQKQQAIHACEDGIRSLLKSPATAKFSNVTITQSPAGGWDVNGSVDAENGFSALVRNSWDCYAEKKDGHWDGRARLND